MKEGYSVLVLSTKPGARWPLLACSSASPEDERALRQNIAKVKARMAQMGAYHGGGGLVSPGGDGQAGKTEGRH